MNKVAYRPQQKATTLFQTRNLELAPEGWRDCVVKMAEGFAEIIGQHAYCLCCGAVLEGAQGHDATCLTMAARRILVNEPLLHALHNNKAPLPGVDIDAVHSRPRTTIDTAYLPTSGDTIDRTHPIVNAAIETPVFLRLH